MQLFKDNSLEMTQEGLEAHNEACKLIESFYTKYRNLGFNHIEITYILNNSIYYVTTLLNVINEEGNSLRTK